MMAMFSNDSTLRKQILESNTRMERAEVLIANLLALRDPIEDKFSIPFDDIVVTLETALAMLKQP